MDGRQQHIHQTQHTNNNYNNNNNLTRTDLTLSDSVDSVHKLMTDRLLNHSLITTKEATDPALLKLEKAAIVDDTPISYSDKELLLLIYNHLEAQGLNSAAQALSKEANLHPSMSPSSSSPASSSTPSKQQLLSKQQMDNNNNNIMVQQQHQNSLDNMVRQYCIDQHRRCAAPISVLPPFSLLTPHQCPMPSHATVIAGKADRNISKRLAARQILSRPSPLHGGRGGYGFTRKFIYSRFYPVKTYYDDDDSVMNCACFVNNNQSLLVGTHDGQVKMYDVQEANLVDSWICHGTLSSCNCYHKDIGNSMNLITDN